MPDDPKDKAAALRDEPGELLDVAYQHESGNFDGLGGPVESILGRMSLAAYNLTVMWSIFSQESTQSAVQKNTAKTMGR